jgi:hypothetical protein
MLVAISTYNYVNTSTRYSLLNCIKITSMLRYIFTYCYQNIYVYDGFLCNKITVRHKRSDTFTVLNATLKYKP